jgi:hypothetical protein
MTETEQVGITNLDREYGNIKHSYCDRNRASWYNETRDGFAVNLTGFDLHTVFLFFLAYCPCFKKTMSSRVTK